MHAISRDGRFFTQFRHKIPHVTYTKFNTRISNELAFQPECTISRSRSIQIDPIANVNGIIPSGSNQWGLPEIRLHCMLW